MYNMKNIIIFFLALFLFSHKIVFSQDLSSYRWKNRLLLVFSQDEDSEKIHKQFTLLQQEMAGLQERKLVLYEIYPEKYKSLNHEEKWINSGSLYEEYKKSDTSFEVVLIGLDGSVKLRQNEILSIEKLFSTIDVMPMRMREMRDKN